MKVAVLGFGTVGTGVVEVLEVNAHQISRKAKESVEVKYILDIRDFKEHTYHEKFTKDIKVILEDAEIGVVVEAMGGLEPAYTYVKSALQKAKSVVTSNKELVAQYGPELIELAKNHKVNFLFEASVGGGIPIIRPLNHALAGDEILEITGILNGTTNFILTKMNEEGQTFEEVLKEAQELGYAERNPEADVEGHDACRKIAILSSLICGKHVDYRDIQTKGITELTVQDMAYAKALGSSIKLLGRCTYQEGRLFASVEPTMIRQNHPLAMVNDVFNGILVNGNMVDDVMFYGRGAGKLPTASAMVADVIEATQVNGKHIDIIWSKEKIELAPREEIKATYFVRIKGDLIYTKTLIREVFGEVEEVKPLYSDEYVFITPEKSVKQIEEQFRQIEASGEITKILIKR